MIDPVIRFYADTHIAKAVAVQLRLRGIDIVRCEEVDMAQAEDDAHLEYAASRGRTVLTNDADFRSLHDQWQQAGKHHAGILYITHDKDDIGMIVDTLTFLHNAVITGAANLENDVYDQLYYLPW